MTRATRWCFVAGSILALMTLHPSVNAAAAEGGYCEQDLWPGERTPILSRTWVRVSGEGPGRKCAEIPKGSTISRVHCGVHNPVSGMMDCRYKEPCVVRQPPGPDILVGFADIEVTGTDNREICVTVVTRASKLRWTLAVKTIEEAD